MALCGVRAELHFIAGSSSGTMLTSNWQIRLLNRQCCGNTAIQPLTLLSCGRRCLRPFVRGCKGSVGRSSQYQDEKTNLEAMFDAASTTENGLVKVEGTVDLQRRQLVDFSFPGAHLTDALSELLGKRVSIRLVSQDIDPATGSGKVSEEAFLEDWHRKHKPILADTGTQYSVTFALPNDFGVPAAILVENHHPNNFRLNKVTLHLPNHTNIVFSCNSWIYNHKHYDGPRIFFTNQACLPNDTPVGVKKLRAQDLDQLRGDGSGIRRHQDRIYDYDVYNDLGNPDKGEKFKRPVLGGSKEYPYPRRCRTGRSHTFTDPTAEMPVLFAGLTYVPRDEFFSNIKWANFLADSVKSVIPAIQNIFGKTKHFDSMEEIFDLYQEGFNFKEFKEGIKMGTKKQYALEFLNAIFDPSTNDPARSKFPLPQILQDNKEAWDKDEEFARQTLAGVNPIVIERLKEFPPVSKLDPKIYGPPTSAITAQHILNNLEGLTLDEALKQKRLFIVDYHDAFLPYLERINELDGKEYASRSLFFLTSEDTLKLVAIELSLPSPNNGDKCKSRVFTPPCTGAPKNDIWLWRLAKAHASINDVGYHQLVSHWLQTHATMEPIIIATNRQLSTLHPLYVLLKPHLKHTININAMSRKVILNAYDGQLIVGGILERSCTSDKYSLEMSTAIYKTWQFDEQALPIDLIKRGMAEEDPNSPYGLKLLIKDYPFAIDGLEIWFAIESWVRDYLSVYYADNATILDDTELQSWWSEIREVGHGDKRDETWWPTMNNIESLQQILTTIIWIASALHASINFGQYSYNGFMPCKPTMGYRLIPEDETPDMKELEKDPQTFYLQSIGTNVQAIIGMSLIRMLSTHSSDEEYLGQRFDDSWTHNEKVLKAFEKFKDSLAKAEMNMKKRNSDPTLKNRYGPAKIPYTLLFPSSSKGLTGRGIPNSTSI